MSTKPKAPHAPSSFRDALLTIDEAAAYLNVPTRWVAEAVRVRRIRCSRIGKHVRFRPEHLDELIAAGEQPVTDPGTPIVPSQPTRTGRSRLWVRAAWSNVRWAADQAACAISLHRDAQSAFTRRPRHHLEQDSGAGGSAVP